MPPYEWAGTKWAAPCFHALSAKQLFIAAATAIMLSVSIIVGTALNFLILR